MKSLKIKSQSRAIFPRAFQVLDAMIKHAKGLTAPGYELRHVSIDVREGSFILFYEEEVEDAAGHRAAPRD